MFFLEDREENLYKVEPMVHTSDCQNSDQNRLQF